MFFVHADPADRQNGVSVVVAVLFENLPDNGVRNQIAQIGFLRPVAGGAFAVEQNFTFSERIAVFFFHPFYNRLRPRRDFQVFVHFRKHFAVGVRCFRGKQIAIRNGFACIVNDNHADIGEFGAGGLYRLPVFARRHNGMGVSVQNQINALRMLVQVHASVSVRGGLRVHAQMRQRNDKVRAFAAQCVDLRPCARIKRRFIAADVGHKLNPLNQARIHFCLCFRRLHTEKADFQAGVRVLIHPCWRQDRLSVPVHIRADNGKFRRLQIVHELFIAEIKLMVSKRRHVIARRVHHGYGVRAFGQADRGIALAEVSRVCQNHVRAFVLELRPQGRDIGVAHDLPVYVVGVQDHRFAGIISRHAGARVRRIVRQSPRAQGKRQRDGEQQRERPPNLFFHFDSSSFPAERLSASLFFQAGHKM